MFFNPLNPPLNRFIEQLYPEWKKDETGFTATMRGVHPTCQFSQVLDISAYLDRVAPSTLTLTFKNGDQVEITSANLKSYRFVDDKLFLELEGDDDERKYFLR